MNYQNKFLKTFLKLFSIFFCFCLPATAQQNAKILAVEHGVSLALAKYRSAVINQIQYKLDLSIPANKTADIAAHEIISFHLNSIGNNLQIDFKPGKNLIKNIKVNETTISVGWQNEHIIVDKRYLKLGVNQVEINFVAGNASLNRNTNYLYTLFVPDHARTAFPCFDQPDLKANFLLSLTIPKTWEALANGMLTRKLTRGDFTTYKFANTEKLPTYLFSFTAGEYTALKRNVGGKPMEFLYRETDSAKIKLSVDSIFAIHNDAIKFLENWTNICFPFQKVGFVAIPDFQFGGMEHPGAVQYNASSLFLDDGATKNQFISRATLISHETAHMWFGDLVTMRWFNDVWMKEVFANFMADKVSQKLSGSETFNLMFLQDHYPAAYGIDRTPGANPIRQRLDNLQDAGTMYGNIIYHKAPIMMRQLEQLMGAENFQKGVRQYLKKYAYQNASWDDLIAILSQYTKYDLYAWNKVWVNQPGRPVFDYNISYSNDSIDSLKINQKPESGAERVWPQQFSIKLYYPTGSKELAINMVGKTVDLTAAKNLPKPSYILFNSDGRGYGIFPTDKLLMEQVYGLKSPLERASAYINAYENTLSNRVFSAADLMKIFIKGIDLEKNELDLRLLTGYINSLYWTFNSPSDRLALSNELEDTLWHAIEADSSSNNKKILFNTYLSIYQSDNAAKKILTIWEKQQPPAGIKLNEDDYTNMALTIALKTDTPSQVLATQLGRLSNTDRKSRLKFLIPALSPDVKVRDSFFYSLKNRTIRSKEAWVNTALSYLHHPLRQKTSIKYLPETLNMLEEIQKTGDIFFPSAWLSGTFSSYQMPEAYKVVQDFLKSHPNYNPKLKEKILQATDNLYRAQQKNKSSTLQ